MSDLSILRGADEHLHKIIMEGVVELALEAPFELRVIEIAGMEVEVIGVDGNRGIVELDDDFHAIAFGAGGEVQQRMLVELELGEHAVEAWVGGFGHSAIVLEA